MGLLAAVAVVAATLVPAPSAEAAVWFVTPTTGNVGDIAGGCPAGSRPSHEGVDINRNANAGVYAAAEGVVTTAVNSQATTGFGSQIVITHADGYTTRYAHLVYGSVTLTVGTLVAQGSIIGLVGSTGQSTGPHLHFEMFRNGANVTNQYFACGQGTVTGLSVLPIRTYPVNADISGDGIPDLLAVSAAGQMFTYTGNGSGGWGTVPFGYGWATTRTLIRGDFDGDGRSDIMAIRDDGTLWHYRNQGGYAFQVAQIGWGWNSMRLVTGGADFNGDRRADIVAVSADQKLYMYTGNGAGGFSDVIPIGQGWGAIDVLLAGDFLPDGRGDLVARDTSGRLYMFPGNGSGVGAGDQIGNGWSGMTAIAGGVDFTSDSNPDIIARDAVGDLWLYPGLGTRVFGTPRKVGNGWNMHRIIQ